MGCFFLLAAREVVYSSLVLKLCIMRQVGLGTEKLIFLPDPTSILLSLPEHARHKHLPISRICISPSVEGRDRHGVEGRYREAADVALSQFT